MIRNTLTEKLIFSFLLLSMGAIGIVGVYSYQSARKAQMSRTYDQLESVRYLKRREVETFYHERLREVETLASVIARTHLNSANSGTDVLPVTRILPIILDQGNFLDFSLMENGNIYSYKKGSDGNFLYADSSEKRKLDSLFKLNSASHNAYISDLIWNPEYKEWVQYIIASVSSISGSKNETTSIAAELRSKTLDSLMLEHSPMNGLGYSGESYLVGKDKLLRSSSRFLPKAILLTRIDSTTSSLAFGGSNGTYLMNDYRGIKVLGSFSILRPPCPEWAVIAEIDLKEAMVPIISIRNNVIFISVFIALIVFIATWWLSKRISRPIIQLQKAAQDLGKGNLGTQVQVTAQDEIGDLAKTFNLMSEQLSFKDKELRKERIGRMLAAFDGQDMERQRLSRELHDGIGQSLIAQKLKLESINPGDTSETRLVLGELKSGSDQLVDEVRRISNALMPAQLTQFGLKAALRQHCDEVSKYSTVEVTFDSTGDFETLDKKTKTYLFRIVQEALNNVIKHAGASTASVEIAQTKGNVFLSISDNGKGFIEDKICPGNGLNNMRERTNLLSGTISINSQPDSGTTIEIQIPINS